MGVDVGDTGNTGGQLRSDGDPPVHLPQADGVPQSGALGRITRIEGNDVGQDDGPLPASGNALEGIQGGGQSVQVVVPGVVEDDASAPAFQMLQPHAEWAQGGQAGVQCTWRPSELEQKQGGGEGIAHGCSVGKGKGPPNGRSSPLAFEGASHSRFGHGEGQVGLGAGIQGPSDASVCPSEVVDG